MTERDSIRGSELDNEFERRMKAVFDRSAGGVDAATRSRLTQARFRALTEGARRTPRFGWRFAAPAGAVAVAALAAWLVLWQPEPVAERGLQASALGDLEILLGEEDLEMLDEDVEFYAWLEDQPEFAPAPKTDDGIG